MPDRAKLLTFGRFLGATWVILFAGGFVYAQDMSSGDAQPPTTAIHANQQDGWAHPELSTNDGWVADMLWIIALGFFLPAAIVGPFIRKRVAAEMPELHDREEQDGISASQHEPGHTK